jgi:hypothetical protein
MLTRRRRTLFVLALVFAAINLGGLLIAVRDRELGHSMGHILLGFLSLFAASWLARTPSVESAYDAAPTDQLNARLGQLQQSLDTIAVEVERIGEAQRFNAKIVAERAERAEKGSTKA